MAQTPTVEIEQIRQLAQLYLSPTQIQSPFLGPFLEQIRDRIDSIGDAREYVTPLITGGIEIPAQLMLVVGMYPEAARFFDAFIREGIVTGDKSAYVDVSAGLDAATKSTGISPNIGELLARIAITGGMEGPDLCIVVRLLGLRETAERVQAAIRIASSYGEMTRAVTREALGELRTRVLGSARASTHVARRISEDMYRHAPTFRSAVEWWAVFLPDRRWYFDENCTAVLAIQNIDVALLCFAQIYQKATGKEVNAFSKSLMAGHEVSQRGKDEVKKAVAVAVTGFSNWPFDVELTCDLIGAKEVTDRLKYALARLNERK